MDLLSIDPGTYELKRQTEAMTRTGPPAILAGNVKYHDLNISLYLALD